MFQRRRVDFGNPNRNVFQRYFLDHFDAKMGALGGLLLGGGVFYAKLPDGYWLASTAAGEQFVFNFLLGGVLMRLCERLALLYERRIVSLIMAIVVPGMINIAGTYIMHCFDAGEVDPIWATVPSMIFAPMGYIWWGRRKRNQWEKAQLADVA